MIDYQPQVPNANVLDPDKIVEFFGIKEGDRIAEFGTGKGFFAFPMARIVGSAGKVCAIDIQRPELDMVRARAQAEHLLNIEFIWSDVEKPNGSKLKDASMDAVLIANALYQVDDKVGVVKEAARILKQGGTLAMIEWDRDQQFLGPPDHLRIPKESARSLILAEGFSLTKEFDGGSHHYGLLFAKM